MGSLPAKVPGEFLIRQGRLVAGQIDSVITKGAGRWLIEEASAQVIPDLLAFLNG